MHNSTDSSTTQASAAEDESVHSDLALEVQGLSKTYPKTSAGSDGRANWKKLIHTLAVKRQAQEVAEEEEFHALRNVSFNLRQGESLGIIGLNGSGKSTLLQIVAGTLEPTSGTVKTRGRVTALLELGSGFNHDFTGRENVFLQGAVLGLQKEEIECHFGEIEAFAEIGQFIDQPARVYSSGMLVRLAFATQTLLEPKIMIIDEALAVGDAFFQAKCMARLRALLDGGLTLLFVSHDSGAVKSLCDRCLFLENGNLAFDGDASEATERYFQSQAMQGGKSFIPPTIEPSAGISKDEIFESHGQDVSTWDEFVRNNEGFIRTANFQRTGNGKALFARVAMLDENGKASDIFTFGSRVTIRMAIEFLGDLPQLGFGYHIRDHNFSEIVYADSEMENGHIVKPRKGNHYLVEWKFNATLRQGRYNLATVLSVPIDMSLGQVEFCDFVPVAAQFTMTRGEKPMIYAPVYWENQLNVQKA